MIAWGSRYIYTTFQNTSMWLAKLGHDPPFLGFVHSEKPMQSWTQSPFYFNGENKANCFWHLMVGLACIRHVMNYSNTMHFFNEWWITLKRHRKRTKRKVLFLDFRPPLTKNWLLSQNEVTIQISLRKNMPNIGTSEKRPNDLKAVGLLVLKDKFSKRKHPWRLYQKELPRFKVETTIRRGWRVKRLNGKSYWCVYIYIYCRLPIGSMYGIYDIFTL